MTLAYWCVLVGALMPLMWTSIAKFTGERKLGPRENLNPRVWLEQREGKQKRAHWAQLNAFEAFPIFAAAVIIGHLNGVSQFWLDGLAMAWVLLRVAYGLLYISDQGQARTLVWTLALMCPVAMFVLGA